MVGGPTSSLWFVGRQDSGNEVDKGERSVCTSVFLWTSRNEFRVNVIRIINYDFGPYVYTCVCIFVRES